jgi:heptaprenyl diphosphate synthase
LRSNLSARRVATLGALLAISLVLSVVESMLGALVPLPIPGVKLGLANIISMFILTYFSLPSALVVAVLRTFLSSLFAGGLSMFLFSAPGAVLSILFMWGAMRFIKPLSLVGISMIGAVVHNLSQVCVAVLITGEVNLFYYAFVLIAIGAVSGAITGIVAHTTFSRAAGALRIKERGLRPPLTNQGGIQ